MGKPFCLPPPSVVPSGASVVELLNSSGARSLMSVPSILEDITLLAESRGPQALASLDFVAFGGGSLKLAVGEKFASAGVRLLNHYGATESGPLAPIFVPKANSDWHYFRLRDDMDLRIEPEPLLGDGQQLYSLITRPFGPNTTFKVRTN